MVTGLHILLTYRCTLECDHCFVYGGPEARGTFTLDRVREVLDQAVDVPTLEWIYFEGGEPFLYYPVMLETLRLAKDMGLEGGIYVVNTGMESNDQALLTEGWEMVEVNVRKVSRLVKDLLFGCHLFHLLEFSLEMGDNH